MVYKYFTYRNFDTKVLYSNFSHSLKKFRYFGNKDFKHLTTNSYQSSLSINRILSHLIYSLKVIKYLIREKVHIVYVIIPPNWLLLTLLLKLNRKTKFIIDVIDLWPEAFPHDNNIFKKSILSIIGIIPKVSRMIAVQKSDFFIAESQYFFKKLKLNGKKNSKVIFIKKIQSDTPAFTGLSEEISIAYLGNIGFIYDFDSLFEIMLGIQKKRRVTLHIIGSGPNRNWFFNQLKNKNLEFIDHGISFDEDFKINKLSQCWFGFNGYKNSTEVALSYKSIDYLSYGIPLLNSAKEDTETLVLSEKIGFNFNEYNLGNLIEDLSFISRDDVIKMKKNAFKTFQNKFSGESFYNEMDTIKNELNL
ncbi:MAG: hypothetical protein CMC63_11220 [Flavobacteriaceae bacterium]|nr:hypothetical protein [Flavobacteriaceae bacterium]|tara:strand:- start:345 stop:1427 length:1083 start_codon:yes stop_codon:yes gene_type:complete